MFPMYNNHITSRDLKITNRIKAPLNLNLLPNPQK